MGRIMDDVVFTSDTHAFHNNIIKYCNRPFDDVVAMTCKLAENINKSLPKGGLLYHLGDWSFGGLEKGIQFKQMINDNIKIILIKGNHDGHNLREQKFRDMFYQIHDLAEVNVFGKKMTICHYAMKVWNKSHHGNWMLYGHSHNTLPDDPGLLSIDVGVDAAAARFSEYRPFTFKELVDIMGRKTWKPVDHHGNREHERQPTRDGDIPF